MAEEYHELTRAFSGLGGLGVDESTLVSALAKWRKQPEKRSRFRKSFPGFFKDHGVIEKCEDEYMLHLAVEFSRFKNLMMLWAMHPWERDARWAHYVLHKAHPATIIVEIACARSSKELLGRRTRPSSTTPSRKMWPIMSRRITAVSWSALSVRTDMKALK